MPRLRSRRLLLPITALAAGCLALLGWTVHANLARSAAPDIAAFSVQAPSGPEDVLALAAPSPAPPAPEAAPRAYSAPQEAYRLGTFIPPVGGWVVQIFGPTAFTLEPPFTYHGVTYPHFHTGIDIDALAGTPVGASAAGLVVQVGSADVHPTGYGNYVVIQHRQGYLTLYAHLERVLVTVGQQVQQLDEIGLVGTTGLSTGPHLHFEIRRYGEFLDPLPYLLGSVRPW